jgi:hypothetical protein
MTHVQIFSARKLTAMSDGSGTREKKNLKAGIGVTTNFSMAHTSQAIFFRGTQGTVSSSFTTPQGLFKRCIS